MTSYYVHTVLLFEEGIHYIYPDEKMTELLEYSEDNINRMKDTFFNSTIKIEVYSEVDITYWLFRILEKLTELGFKIYTNTDSVKDNWLRMYKG